MDGRHAAKPKRAKPDLGVSSHPRGGFVLRHLHRGEYVEPSKMAVGEWPAGWLETAIKPPNKRLRTYETYKAVIEHRLKPTLGHV
jgi:hypothetical protein